MSYLLEIAFAIAAAYFVLTIFLKIISGSQGRQALKSKIKAWFISVTLWCLIALGAIMNDGAKYSKKIEQNRLSEHAENKENYLKLKKACENKGSGYNALRKENCKQAEDLKAEIDKFDRGEK